MAPAETYRPAAPPLPWDFSPAFEDASGAAANVGDAERAASTIGGGTLVALGLWRGGFGGLALAALGGALIHRGVTGRCELYRAIGASTAEPGPDPIAGGVPARPGVRVEESVTINRPADELYRYWREYANLPRFMRSIESVTAIDTNPRRSHWVARTPVGPPLEWEAEIHNDEPGRLIAWRSVEGSRVETAGSVHFEPAPGGRGTEVRVNWKVNPPGGALAALAARAFGADPATETREDLRRFKQLMEAGELPTVHGQPSGRRPGGAPGGRG